MKAVMARVCGRVVAVVDHTKLGQVGLAPFVRISGLSRVIIDRGVETEVVDQLRGAGVEVQLV